MLQSSNTKFQEKITKLYCNGKHHLNDVIFKTVLQGWHCMRILLLFSSWFNGRRGIEVTYDTQEKSNKKYKNANRRSWCIKMKLKTTTLDKEVTNQ